MVGMVIIFASFAFTGSLDFMDTSYGRSRTANSVLNDDFDLPVSPLNKMPEYGLPANPDN
jgi:hypothetical protein